MESFSVKLKRAQLSTEVGEDGPALETVLEGPLLYQGGLSERWRNGKADDDRIRWDIKGSPGIWLPIIESNKAAVDWTCDSLQLLHTAVRNSLTCRKERELCRVSRG